MAKHLQAHVIQQLCRLNTSWHPCSQNAITFISARIIPFARPPSGLNDQTLIQVSSFIVHTTQRLFIALEKMPPQVFSSEQTILHKVLLKMYRAVVLFVAYVHSIVFAIKHKEQEEVNCQITLMTQKHTKVKTATRAYFCDCICSFGKSFFFSSVNKNIICPIRTNWTESKTDFNIM